MSVSLYFIAVLPPEEIQEEITQFKHEVAEEFNSSHALKSPPHITLHMPFRWKESKFEILEKMLEGLNSAVAPFTLQLNGFDFFEPRVVFVDVVESEQLEELQKKVVSQCRRVLKLDNGNYKDRPFHPHVTIGFRDLKKPDFYRAQKHFTEKEYSRKFSVERITLLKHDGKEWNTVL